jgi:rhodanese-related sulfurtransferase
VRRRETLAGLGAGLTGILAGCSGRSGKPDEETYTPSETASPTDGGRTPSTEAPFEHLGTLDGTFVVNGDFPADGDPGDGFPPEFPNPPPKPDVDESSFETLDVNGEAVTLTPIDVIEVWYRRAEARFVDARGLGQYRRSHIYGSVLSTAQRGSTGGGIEEWPKDDRIVTFCGCPHHLSSIRAAGLQKAGFSEVYVIDEGFGVWAERGYPMSGLRSTTQSDISERVIEGELDARYAGEYVWAAVDRQYEAAPIQEDGRFTLVLKFSGVTDETPVRVSTPTYTVTRPLGELTSEISNG